MEQILLMVSNDAVHWISSTVLELEVSRNPHRERRGDTEALLRFATGTITSADSDAKRARELQNLGFGPFDALHLTVAERARVDVFLTTEDDLIRRARNNAGVLQLRVENPVSWWLELQP